MSLRHFKEGMSVRECKYMYVCFYFAPYGRVCSRVVLHLLLTLTPRHLNVLTLNEELSFTWRDSMKKLDEF